MNEKRPELIVCAACKLIDTDTNEIYQVVGVRHYDFVMRDQIRQIEKNTKLALVNEEQGFLTSSGRFVDRKEALKIAKANNQIKFGIGYEPDELYSEMLY